MNYALILVGISKKGSSHQGNMELELLQTIIVIYTYFSLVGSSWGHNC